MLKDDSILVRELLKGNLLAFNTLYKLYSRNLYRFAYGYLKSVTETEDLIQEVFTKIWERRSDLKGDLSFKSYLFTITFNLIKKHFRRKSQILGYLASVVKDDLDEATLEKINHDSLYRYLTDIVDKLPTKRKQIFIKSRFEGLTIKEISRELNISHKTVENQLTDALNFIRTNLRKWNELAPVLFLTVILY